MNADWNTFLASRRARIAEQQVTDFGNPAAELQALANGSIMADLSHLSLLQVDGADAVNFLQGQFTNDIKLLEGGHSQYTGYCTAKGRLLAIFLAFARQEHLYLQLNGALAAAVTKRLKMYVLRSKVAISDVSDDTVRIGVAGARAEAALQRLLGSLPAQPHAVLALAQATLLRLPGTIPRFQILAAPDAAPALWDALSDTCQPVGRAGWEWLQIRAGIPDITPATQEAFVPQMVNLDLLGGINFKKGC
jgi:folate-binding Fe-S cluster repair protein YgfZ